MNKLKVFRWTDQDGGVHEYRFSNNICMGFYSNGKESDRSPRHKGKQLTKVWRGNLTQAGFKLIDTL